ncbi:MAG: hypothetical protein ACREEM_06335 [Blastocatellia bacterium]
MPQSNTWYCIISFMHKSDNSPHLVRGMGLLQSTAANMLKMIGLMIVGIAAYLWQAGIKGEWPFVGD